MGREITGTSMSLTVNPIGYINSVFTYKNGTPRQPSLCTYARGTLTIEKSLFTNPEHSLENLEEFSHVWIIFVFHKNNNTFTKAKVKPPRLNGKRVGVFSTRSPYRPNPIGLTLAKLEKVQGSTVHFSGIDLLDGTPVLDIKPYIPAYDVPNLNQGQTDSDEKCDFAGTEELDQATSKSQESSSERLMDGQTNSDTECIDSKIFEKDKLTVQKSCDSTCMEFGLTSKENSSSNKCLETNSRICSDSDQRIDTTRSKQTMEESSNHHESICHEEIKRVSNDKQTPNTPVMSTDSTSTADWLQKPPINKLNVRFTNYAQEELKQFSRTTNSVKFCLKYFKSSSEVLKSICDILQEDPRSVYRRKNCMDNLYYFVVDIVHVTAWFSKDTAEIVRVQPVCEAEHFKIDLQSD